MMNQIETENQKKNQNTKLLSEIESRPLAEPQGKIKPDVNYLKNMLSEHEGLPENVINALLKVDKRDRNEKDNKSQKLKDFLIMLLLALQPVINFLVG